MFMYFFSPKEKLWRSREAPITARGHTPNLNIFSTEKRVNSAVYISQTVYNTYFFLVIRIQFLKYKDNSNSICGIDKSINVNLSNYVSSNQSRVPAKTNILNTVLIIKKKQKIESISKSVIVNLPPYVNYNQYKL